MLVLCWQESIFFSFFFFFYSDVFHTNLVEQRITFLYCSDAGTLVYRYRYFVHPSTQGCAHKRAHQCQDTYVNKEDQIEIQLKLQGTFFFRGVKQVSS